MQFLKSEVQFKAIARALEIKFRHAPAIGGATPDLVFDVFKRFPGLECEPRLRTCICELLDRLSRCRISDISYMTILRMLSLSFAGVEYDDLKKTFKSPFEFRHLFYDAKVAPSRLEYEVPHPFPHQLRRLPFGDKWARVWGRNAKSTPKSAFFPPMPPIPGVAELHHHSFQLRRDWDSCDNLDWLLSKGGYFLNGRAAVVVKDSQRRLAAGFRWYWWGSDCVAGIDCFGLIRFEDHWWKVSFDIRPRYALPTLGPHIRSVPVGKETKYISACVEEFRSVRPRCYNDSADISFHLNSLLYVPLK